MKLRALLVLAAVACGQDPAAPDPAPKPVAPPPPEYRPPQHAPDSFREARLKMVQDTIWGRGVRDRAVLDAMRNVPRHRFVPADEVGRAYADRPLPIGEDQTISQPYIVASMTEELELKPDAKVLEIGTGSGYQAAVLAHITPHVWSIEIKRPLFKRATKTLKALGYTKVRTRLADGYHGWKEHAPFDAIIVTAAAPHVPPPLVRQLAKGGRLVLPVGPPFGTQDLRLVTKDAQGRVRTKSLYPVRFVPLTGSLGKKRD